MEGWGGPYPIFSLSWWSGIGSSIGIGLRRFLVIYAMLGGEGSGVSVSLGTSHLKLYSFETQDYPSSLSSTLLGLTLFCLPLSLLRTVSLDDHQILSFLAFFSSNTFLFYYTISLYSSLHKQETQKLTYNLYLNPPLNSVEISFVVVWL